MCSALRTDDVPASPAVLAAGDGQEVDGCPPWPEYFRGGVGSVFDADRDVVGSMFRLHDRDDTPEGLERRGSVVVHDDDVTWSECVPLERSHRVLLVVLSDV
jgi:hypothetical protein